MSYCPWTKNLHTTHEAGRRKATKRTHKPKPAQPSRFSTHSHFKQEIGLGSRPDVCANCRMPFEDHYNGACPKDENEKS
jgi:hypothetical protein